MLNMFKKQSMRVRLLSLIFISFTLAIAGLGTGVVVIQKNLLNQMDASVAQLLKENDTQMNTQFTTLGKEITNSLDQIPESVGSQIVNKTTDALNKEKDIVSADFENSLKMSMESLAVILAKVAPAAILSNDFTTLISYVKSASSGKDVIYAIYLRPDGRPLTRYYDRQNPKIKEFIETSTEKRKINKVLQASKNDPSVMIVQKTIELDGTVLGSVILCASKETMGEKLKAMDHRFSNLIKSNDLETANALNQESKKIIEHFSSKLNNISQSNSHSVQKVGEQIQKSISDIRNQIRWLIIVLGAVSIIIISIILFFVISNITKRINIIAKTINTGSAEVAEASEHVSRSSQTLAEASTEQASAIEETSASMEEMSSMTKTNA
ncbi:MAG: methyl-accepting chemotaxis protein, partial [Desulfobacteraceae bacterium]|nr:methyl-accepting chemotaxis protein [Desulfobacteraceae bacterium]